MKKNYIFVLLYIFLITAMVSGCDTIADLLTEETPQAATPSPTASASPTPPALGVDTPISLQVWLPPEFDPAGDSEASRLLLERLREYSQLHPGVRVVTRVKASEGPASLIESLNSAVSAAPLALPDLVMLSTDDIQTASDSNLIYPLEAEIDFTAENDWYQFAGDLVVHGQESWGIPVAADAMVMVYRSNQTPDAPSNWGDLFEQGQRLMFPATDPQALFTILMYLSESEQSSAALAANDWDRAALERVLGFYDQAQTSNLIPYWISQLESDQLVWEAYLENQAELAVTWMSRYLQEGPDHTSAAPIPTRGGVPSTLVTGWVWAVATPQSDRQAAAEELAVFLAEAEFTGSWTRAAGLLPVRPSGLTVWDPDPDQALANLILPTALAAPDPATLAAIGKPLERAVTAILKQELNVSEAVSAVFSDLQVKEN